MKPYQTTVIFAARAEFLPNEKLYKVLVSHSCVSVLSSAPVVQLAIPMNEYESSSVLDELVSVVEYYARARDNENENNNTCACE